MKELFENDFDYHEDLVATRGFIINKSIIVESNIDRILLTYYFKGNEERIPEFNDDILKTFSFTVKLQILKKTLKRIKKNTNIDYSKNLIKVLQSVFELRNKVAHWNWSQIWAHGIYLKKDMKSDELFIRRKEIEIFISECVSANAIMSKILVDIGYWEDKIKGIH